MNPTPDSKPIVWITGASSGIGEALARAYAKVGATLILSARSEDKLEAVAREIVGRDGAAHAMALDVTDAAACRAAVSAMQDIDIIPDICILNAGTYVRDSVRDFDLEGCTKQIDVNLKGAMNCFDAILPVLKDKETPSRIGFVSSVAGYRGIPYSACYSASKAAITAFAEAIRPECAEYDIDVKLISPGFIKTPLTAKNNFPMPFLMDADKAAWRIVRGMETRRFEITMPKRFTWMIKGLQRLPYALYFPLSRRVLRPRKKGG